MPTNRWDDDEIDQLSRMVRYMYDQLQHLTRGAGPPPSDYPGRRQESYTSESWREQMQEAANPITTVVVESTYPDAGRLGGTAIGILCARPGADIRWARRRGLDPSRRSIVISVIDSDQGTHMPIVFDVEDAKQIVNRLSEAIGTAEDEASNRNWPWQ
jgi:hypothetical protein